VGAAGIPSFFASGVPEYPATYRAYFGRTPRDIVAPGGTDGALAVYAARA
jgi:hypothetical protein